MLVKGVQQNSEERPDLLSEECANAVYDICVSGGLLNDDCSLNLDAPEDTVRNVIGSSILGSSIPASLKEEYVKHEDDVVKTIMHSRYVNLYKLLRVSQPLLAETYSFEVLCSQFTYLLLSLILPGPPF